MVKTAVVNRIINEKGETLFLLRATKPFGWCLPGGKVDMGGDNEDIPVETNDEACMRETFEETRVNIIKMKTAWDEDKNSFRHIGATTSFNGVPVEVYETVLDHTPEVVINKREHMSRRWIKTHTHEYQRNYTDEVRQLAFAGNTLDFIDLGRPHFVPDFS
jgi:ADP-ribose pyrophosphatase YjhB (NUDIX family)